MDIRSQAEINMLKKLGLDETEAAIIVLGKNNTTHNPVVEDLINMKKRDNEIMKEEISRFQPAEMNFSYANATLAKLHNIPIQKVASFRRIKEEEE